MSKFEATSEPTKESEQLGGGGVTKQKMVQVGKSNSDIAALEIDHAPSAAATESRRSLSESIWAFFFPEVVPLPFSTFLILSFLAAIPAVLYIVAFTKIGFGLAVFNFISDNLGEFAWYLGVGLVSFAFSLYLFDCYYWKSQVGVFFRRFFIVILIIAIVIFIFAVSGSHPYGPISLFIIFTTAWMMSMRHLFYNDVPARTYISSLSGPLLFVSFLVFLSWLLWTFLDEDNEWNLFNKITDAMATGCKPNFDDYPDCEVDNGGDDDGDGEICLDYDEEDKTVEFGNDCPESCGHIYSHCLNTFIIWGGPFLVSVGYFFLSFFASFLREGDSSEQDAGKLAKIWMFLLFGVWISASLSGAGTGVSTTLAALTLSSFVASAIFIVSGYSSIEREERFAAMWDKIIDKYGPMLDPMRGLFILTCSPVFLVLIFFSFLVQSIRNLKTSASSPPTDTFSLRHISGAGWVTVEFRRLIRVYLSWDRSKIFTYAVYWGIAFMTMSVIVSEFTVVFLSWLIEKTSGMNLYLVTAILVGVGMTMFLLPPVPGVPIYLTLGIVIIPVGRENYGILGSITYAMFVSLCLKLSACTLQQKLIGGLLKDRVGVRQFVGVNSKVIRSMKLILAEKGMGIAKVSILVGGPDWPTSVLCGIMDLSLLPILVGTLPIVFLILPTLLTGSFIYMASLNVDGQPEFPWAGTMATIFFSITGVVQFGSMVVAAYFLERAVSERGDELDKIPIDEEVKEADDKLEDINEAYSRVTQWECLPIWTKTVLQLSLVCMIVTCYMVYLFQDDCFAEYQLTYTIDEHLNGNWLNVVRVPLGLTCIILFIMSMILLQVFRSWAMVSTKNDVSGQVNVRG